jgi:signal transduction histidine kinase/ActR/RegA family two-component response regulator
VTNQLYLPIAIEDVPKGFGWALSGHISMLGLFIFVPLLYKSLRKKTKQELLAKNIELEQIKNELIQQQRMKDHFIGTVSHALRTPMNSIIGFNDLLREDVQSDPMLVKLQDMVGQSAQHLLTVINDILDYSQMELGHLKLKQEDFDLKQTVRNALEMFEASGHQAGLSLQLEMGDVPQWVQGDSQRLTQIMVNLLSNAIKFTTRGHVLVRLSGQGHMIQFDVEDTGVGIPHDRLLHIFEPFEQAGAHKLRRQGYGLGLSITKRLVQAQKGWITVDSELGRGTKFSFALELMPAQVVPAHPSASPDTHINGETLTILIVDDQHLNRLLAIQVLQRAWPQAKLLEATNGVQALAAIDQHAVDLILMDVLMPEMDGITATRQIRQHASEKIATTPILGLTANANEVTHRKCIEAGMNDIVFKPFQRIELIHKIEMLTQLSAV